VKSLLQPASIYLHIPFCRKRCAYCDFTTYAGLDALIPVYAGALAHEINLVADSRKESASLSVHTIYIGGGTPSLLPPHLLRQILAAMRQSFDISPDAEITIEANPGTLDLPYLTALRAMGVNRLSIGAQSAQSEELRLLDRSHSFQDVVKVVRAARTAAFNNVNLDLIFGLPGQQMTQWRDTLRKTLALQPEHLSLYALTLERATPLRTQVESGTLTAPDSDRAADMYECATEKLAEYGFSQYEISNWAHNSGAFACRHNLQYWQNLPYLAFGAGAHGWFNGWRYANTRSPQLYIERLKPGKFGASHFPFSPAVSEKRAIDRQNEMNETMMMGLRLLREGVPRSTFQSRFGVHIEHEYGAPLRRLRSQGLLAPDGDRVRLSSAGRLLGNRVFAEFV